MIDLPVNVTIGEGTVVTGDLAFKRFKSARPNALTVGAHCTMDGVQFAIGEEGAVSIGDFSCFTNAVLLAEEALTIGSYVLIGWNTTIADTDFHPIGPAQRIADAIACSPLGDGARPAIVRRAVTIEDDVWIGPNATILKGVRIGRGAIVHPGAVVTEDVPAGATVLGNPARVVASTKQ